MKKRFVSMMIFGLLLMCSEAQVTSVLWGVDGEAWNTNGILRDFTHVGYKGGGTNTIPNWPVGVVVTNFGAIPDDGIDDTDQIMAAISNCPNYSAVYFPKGRYIITKRMQIYRDHFVLRGEDMYESVLFFPKYLSEVYIEQVGWSPRLPYNADRNVADGFFIEMMGGTEKSIENLSIEFREQRKGGVWEYKGAAAVSYGDYITDSWIRNVRIKNYDSGIQFNRADRLSLINIMMDQFNGRQSVHNGAFDAYGAILPRDTSSSLCHNIDITGHVLQPVDMNEVSRYSVFSKISTGEMNNRVVGLHGGSTHYHLYTELNKRVNREDGDGGMPVSSWSDNTYWNVGGDLTEYSYLNSTNRCIYVGFGDQWPLNTNNPTAFWYEPAAFGQLTPSNLYLAQLDYFGMPHPEPLIAPIPKPYERAGDLIRIRATDDITPGGDPVGTLDSASAYFKFDLSAASETNVAQARLSLNLNRIDAPPYQFSVWMVTDDSWSEETLTVTNQPVVVSVLDSQWILDGDMNPTLEFDVTEFVRNQLVDGDGVISLYVDRQSGGSSSFWSDELGPKPELLIERTASSVANPPSAPKGIGCTSLVGNIVLDWDDNPESDVVTYKVYRTPYEALPMSIAQGLITSDFVDVASEADWHTGTMDHRQLYHYWITAVDDHGYESEMSREFVAAVLHPSNAPPAFIASVSLDNATARNEYSDDLSTEASDPESDQLYFMKVSGPDWLNVELDGTLSGMPDLSDAGSNTFTFQLTALGGSTQKVVNIVVDLPSDTPSGTPAVPTGLNASVDDSLVSLSWNNNAEADLYGYNVYRSLSSGSLGNLLTTVTGTNTVADTTVSNDVTYWYTVKAVDTSDNESGGAQTSATPSDPDPAPAAPTNLVATAGDYFVDLSWGPNGEGDLAGYTVYRTGLSGVYYGDPLATNVTETTYRDNTAQNGATYYYVVTAVDAGGNKSPVSNEDSATPSDLPPEAPKGLFTFARDGEVYLHWDASTDVDLASYSVFRSLTAGVAGTVVQSSLTDIFWTDNSVANGTTYYYTVKAVDAGAQISVPSDEVPATPQSGLQTTVFTDADGANNLISNPGNWNNGLPTVGKKGLMINLDADMTCTVSHDDYEIVHMSGTTLYVDIGSNPKFDGGTFVQNGGVWG